MQDQEVVFRVVDSFESCDVLLTPVAGPVPDAVRQALERAKAPPPISITPKEPFGGAFSPVDALTPSDIRFFGGKAANYGSLRQAIPDHSRTAVAFSFDLWDAFLEQPGPFGGTLGGYIRDRLAPHAYPPNMAALRQDLERIRDAVRDGSFAPEHRSAILEALGDFDPERKIRFRSSTNAEDSAAFSGAGLYDSFSGCVQDDQDADEAGPSHCDPTKAKERGVFRAIKKVYASFYNDNAYLERLRHSIDESTVGMAILAHHSFPDETELANGVVTGSFRDTPTSTSFFGEFVTQAGAVSVANPEGDARPERVSYSRFGNSAFVDFKEGSSLVLLGDYVMEWEKDYLDLGALVVQASARYLSYFPERVEAEVDLEYKRIAPGDLVVKQIREIPAPPAPPDDVFLFSTPTEWTLFQGEFGDLYANHRLKSDWGFTVRNTTLTPAEINRGVFSHLTAALHDADGGPPALREGSPDTFPNHDRVVLDDTLAESWDEASARATLTVDMTFALQSEQRPALTLDDMRLTFEKEHAAPVFHYDFNERRQERTRDIVVLAPRQSVDAGSLAQERDIASGGVAVRTQFYWPAPPTGAVAGYTAPLIAWIGTTIEGLTDEPIALSDERAQTYLPGHHNFSEEFLFEPRIDPHVTAEQKAALAQRGVVYVYALHGGLRPIVRLLDADGRTIVL